MDYAASSSRSNATASLPPISRHHQSRKKSFHDHLHYHDDEDRAPIQPASPEVISSLITSLSVISKPAATLFEGPSLSAPPTPGDSGSFGVDYGAFLSPTLAALQEEEGVPLDELAASPPIIKTAKPPSGLSPLTAPKSPRSPRHESSGGLRSLLRSSRPSSRGSMSSRDESHSIGNPSIERGLSPTTPELHRRRSADSWGKRSNRHSSGLMFMSSKERLRATSAERERRHVSAGALGSTSNDLMDTTISEEPPNNSDSAPRTNIPTSPYASSSTMQRPIPARDSSLRKTDSHAKRSSHRPSRAKRDSGALANDSIPERDERDHRSRDPSASQRRGHGQPKYEESAKRGEDGLRPEPANGNRRGQSSDRYLHESARIVEQQTMYDGNIEDGAPFPAVHQSRRRSLTGAEKRKSGRTTPEPGDPLKIKRSSSRMKRLSGAKSPEPGDRGRATTPEPHVGYERPRSADSIDDAVESYLCSPRLSQKIKHPQTGRVISFSEVGDSEGSAVFCCVGMGLTRYITAFYDELALTLKLRLITPDRPGVGDSESYADGTGTPLSWPDDVYAICQALKITKFSILAHSAGAIYALATALRMPQHIRGKIHLLAPWIPPSQMNVFSATQATPPSNAIPTSQRILRALPTPFLKAANSSFMTATSSSITSSIPKSPRRTKRKASGRENRREATPGMDKENVAHEGLDARKDQTSPSHATETMDQIRPTPSDLSPQAAIISAAADAIADKERQSTYDIRLTHAIWNLATTGANPAVDLLVCLERRHTIGFRYVDITRPVVIHHGSRDNRVPVDNVIWLGKTMRRCEVRVLEGEGHGLMASATVMGSVLMEMSKEWEEWNKATGSTRRHGEKDRGRSSRAGMR